MVGNDIKDDACIAQLGSKIYLATDLFTTDQLNGLDDFPHGRFIDFENELD